MWGVCLDNTICDGKLFQAVIEYTLSADKKTADIVYPVKGIQVLADHIKPVDRPPRFVEGDLVSPVDHPEWNGVVRGVGWHFKNRDYMYYLTVNGRKKSKRYWGDDLQSTICRP